MQYEYFYGAQAEQFSFYRIPKALFTEPNFRELSTDAKVLYGILLDRMSLSLKNQWLCCMAKQPRPLRQHRVAELFQHGNRMLVLQHGSRTVYLLGSNFSVRS